MGGSADRSLLGGARGGALAVSTHDAQRAGVAVAGVRRQAGRVPRREPPTPRPRFGARHPPARGPFAGSRRRGGRCTVRGPSCARGGGGERSGPERAPGRRRLPGSVSTVRSILERGPHRACVSAARDRRVVRARAGCEGNSRDLAGHPPSSRSGARVRAGGPGSQAVCRADRRRASGCAALSCARCRAARLSGCPGVDPRIFARGQSSLRARRAGRWRSLIDRAVAVAHLRSLDADAVEPRGGLRARRAGARHGAAVGRFSGCCDPDRTVCGRRQGLARDTMGCACGRLDGGHDTPGIEPV